MSVLECASHSNSIFVDDNGVLALRLNIGGTLHNSAIAAFLLFGWPHEDWRSSCFAPHKWERDASSAMLYLGFLICSRTLRVTWPLYKCTELFDEITQALSMKRPWFKPKVVASIIRKLWSASLIAPWEPYLSFSLAMALNHAVRSTYEAIRRWWQRGRVWVSKSVQHDLQIVATYLQEPEYSPVWSRYIGLIVPPSPDAYDPLGRQLRRHWRTVAGFSRPVENYSARPRGTGLQYEAHQQIQAGAS